MDTSKPSWIALWSFSVLTFGVTLFPNFGFSRAMVIFGESFEGIVNVERKFHIEITPMDWTFFIWNIVFAWQIVWMVYTGSLILRTSGEATISHLYYSPPFVSNYLFIAFMLSSFFNFMWNIFWCLEYLRAAVACAFFLGVALYVTQFISMHALSKHGQELVNRGKKKDVFYNIFFLQWGIGIYASWVTISIVLNLTPVLQYYEKISAPTSAAISLSFLLVIITVWFSIDNFFFEKQCRYFFIPYLVAIFYFIGCLQKNWSGDLNSQFIAVLLSYTCLLIMIKIVLVMCQKEPIFEWNNCTLENRDMLINTATQRETQPLLQDERLNTL